MDTPDSKLVTPREIALLSADEAYKAQQQPEGLNYRQSRGAPRSVRD